MVNHNKYCLFQKHFYKKIYQMKLNNIETEDIIDTVNEYPLLKYLAYGASAVIGIWVIGKAAKLLANAVINFKHLYHAINN